MLTVVVIAARLCNTSDHFHELTCIQQNSRGKLLIVKMVVVTHLRSPVIQPCGPKLASCNWLLHKLASCNSSIEWVS